MSRSSEGWVSAKSNEPGMIPPGRRAGLRAATMAAHERLDALVDEAGFFDNRPSYSTYLEATWQARQPIELAMDASGLERLFPAWPRSRIHAALRADIVDVGATMPACGDGCPGPLRYAPSEALGVLYVLEGSALGARLLAPRAARLGLTASFGARHFAVQISAPHSWPAFLAILETTRLDDSEERACIEAAIATFARFERAYATDKAP